MENNGKYYLVDRYYCFTVDGYVLEGLDVMVREIRGIVFHGRLVNDGSGGRGTSIDEEEMVMKVNWRYIR